MQNRHLTFLLVALVGLSATQPLTAQSTQTASSDSLAAAIKKVASAVVIVDAQDVNATACKPVGESPGLIRADFNGDRRDDYAALLKTKETGKEKTWDGKTLREARFSFVLFLDDGRGGYRPRVVRRYTDFISNRCSSGLAARREPPSSRNSRVYSHTELWRDAFVLREIGKDLLASR